MEPMLDVAKEFLAQDGLKFAEQPGALFVNMAGPNGKFGLGIRVVNDCLLCAGLFPVNAPAARRPQVMELLTRLNWNLLVGNWELDLDDGEVRYRTSVPARNVELTPGHVRDVCYLNVSALDAHWATLLSVMFGDVTPLEALAAAARAEASERRETDDILRKLGFDGEAGWAAGDAEGRDADER